MMSLIYNDQIANTLNQYFCKIGRELTDKIPHSKSNSFLKYMRNPISSSLFFESAQPTEIFNIIKSLSKTNANGHDAIPSFFLRTAANVLAILLDFAFTFGLFPEALKIAKVISIYKGGAKTELNNYRPISLLPKFSKILEKLMYARTLQFFTKHSVLIPTQYGFRSKHAISHVLINTISNAFDNMDQKLFSAFLLLDLTKAFDTVNHDILHKLQHYGICGITHTIFSHSTLSSINNIYLGAKR